MKKTLKDYCKSKKIGLYELSRICGLYPSHVYFIDRNPDSNLRLKTVNTIYLKTKEQFGEGLKPNEYLHSCVEWS